MQCLFILCNKLLEQKSKHNKLSFCWNVPKIRDSYGPFFRRNYCECYKLKRFTIILNPGVVIGDNQILPNLSASVLASILGLFINSKLDLSSVCFFFSPAAIKISCVHCSWRFCLRKKSVVNARRNDELSFPLPHTLSWHFLEFFFVSPSSKKNR